MKPTIDWNQLTTLIIDDDPIFQETIAGMLEMIGVSKVLRADSGKNAVEVIKELKKPVDCIICDYNMSNGNGLQLLQFVRTGQMKYMRPDTCFILLTSSADTNVVYVAAHLDVNGYLVKPATVDKLRATIERARTRYFPLDIKKYSEIVIPD